MQRDFESPKSQWYWWWKKDRSFASDYSPFPDRFPRKDPGAAERAKQTYRKFIKRVEIAAFRYELARRFDRSKKWPPFPQLPPDHRELLQDFGQGSPLRDRPPTISSNKWIRVPELFVNPNASLHAIMGAFEQRIKKESQNLGIKRPAGPRAVRHRPVSWRMVELLDLDANFRWLKEQRKPNKEKLSASERKAVSRAKADSRKYHDDFRQALVKLASYEEPDVLD